MAEDTSRIRELAKQERATYLEKTGLLFHRR